LDFIDHRRFEVGFASCLGKAMKQKELNLLIGCWALLCLSISMLLLYKATQELPIGTAYAVWTGIGAVELFSGYRCI
jgi:quaternary ammonium compound-resistance protein SugE